MDSFNFSKEFVGLILNALFNIQPQGFQNAGHQLHVHTIMTKLDESLKMKPAPEPVAPPVVAPVVEPVVAEPCTCGKVC